MLHKGQKELGLVAHSCNPHSHQAKTGLLQIQGNLGLQSEILLSDSSLPPPVPWGTVNQILFTLDRVPVTE